MKLLNHWILQRITAILLIPSIIGIIISFIETANNVSFEVYNGTNIIMLLTQILNNQNVWTQISGLIIFGIIIIHMIEGIENIIMDYVQNTKLKEIIFKLLKIITICLFKCVCIYILLI